MSGHERNITLLYLLVLLLLRQNLWCIRKVGWAPGTKNGPQMLYCKKYVCKKYAPLRTWADAGTWKCCQQFPSTRRGTPLDQQSISKTWRSGHRETHRTWTSCRQKGSTCHRRNSFFFICLTLCLLAPRLVEKAKLLLLEFLIGVRILGPQHVFVANSRLVAIFLLRLALMPELCSAFEINSFRQSCPLDPVKIDT